MPRGEDNILDNLEEWLGLKNKPKFVFLKEKIWSNHTVYLYIFLFYTVYYLFPLF